ncbi:hypothetical protein HPG69_002105 [Diceros bicornis minor]|uniref:Uncharacterized protein n=1 Tax=Diceros bicornis minor TaxID=77932 RepID=A0A7J7FD80_DICBM|nr:hypothetical protein HPG69_002105 [Diceros bicornis minor]
MEMTTFPQRKAPAEPLPSPIPDHPLDAKCEKRRSGAESSVLDPTREGRRYHQLQFLKTLYSLQWYWQKHGEGPIFFMMLTKDGEEL